ncbi:siderophore-interacting protein [filamentous cyanobacterium LEGE 11480]|uniref:Siderophore-interacting protein n=1 Tax=Romeriopsis navalis LEGE 11480 TaxID=2777977 RepID=A0A928Z3H2_9CYAN|nr:siderophore-interacting protein [Romeriopsis navalis]MBE9029300.1 siderophore-interacting protein [Romeriopsis navalis LEGE 11480]
MRQVTVQTIEQITPRVRRIVFGGETLAGFSAPRPGAHIKLLFGTNPNEPPDPKQLRSQMRTYTPRKFNPETNELTVEFVLHGSGLASTWAAQAQVGESVTIAGAGGGMDIPDTLKMMVMLVDESAIPAAGAVLEALPASCKPIIICEVEDAREQRSLSSSIEATPTWLFRKDKTASPGLLLEKSLPDVLTCVQDFDDLFWWIACEANAMRRMRSQLLNQHGVSKDRLVSRGYWKLETSNHPDHDYGES